MQEIFVNIYNLILKHKVAFYSSLVVLVLSILFFASKLEFEESITSIIPDDERLDDINVVVNSLKTSDQIILNFSLKDSTVSKPDSIIQFAERITEALALDTSYIENIRFKIEEDAFLNVYQFFYDNLPLYMSDSDYVNLKSRLTDSEINKTLKKNFKSLISPTGIATKKFIFQDPFSLTPRAIKRLEDFQLDDNFMVYKSCVFTKDKQNLLVFIDPKFPASETSVNKSLLKLLENKIAETSTDTDIATVEYYGGTVVAVENANRIKTDIILTVSIAVLFLILLFWRVFKNFRVLILLFVPVVLGAGISLSIMSLIDGKISAIAMGVGAILVGISIDFSLHLFTHYRSSGSVKDTIRHIAEPILMSSLTTASAFLCLYIVRSEALQQLGMFAAFSVLAASIIVLTVIPFFLSGKKINKKNNSKNKTILDKVAAYEFEKNRVLLFVILGLTILFGFTSQYLGFNGDISTLNYMSKDLSKAEANIKRISSEALSAVYVITTANTLNEALLKTEMQKDLFEKCMDENLISSMSSAADLLISENEQILRINKWNNFWNEINRDSIKEKLIEKGGKYHFKENAFNKFYSLINKDFKPIANSDFSTLNKLFLSNYVSHKDSIFSVISVLKVDMSNKKELFSKFENNNDIVIFDQLYLTNKFFEVLKEDFNKLVFMSMVIVFIILLVFLGRIELALITYTPIALSWLWTIGLMGLFGIKFNIFNIIVTTFIFGLGIDYSIFIMRGLLNNYKYGNLSIVPYKMSILLSGITTLVGIGVLIFAQHPALRSIALVSIFGIASVIIITYTILPLLFSYLVYIKGKERPSPVVFLDLLISWGSMAVFIGGALILTILIPIFYILPLPKKKKKYYYHYLIHLTSKLVVKANISIKREHIDKLKFDLSSPKVIIANHQSHLDIVLILMLNPKIIVLTNEWVWKNPFYGLIIRYADFYPVYEGIDGGYERIKNKVADGYSVLIFPEGTRTSTGGISRFHQGSLAIADYLKLDILPVIIKGAFECLPKTEFIMRSGNITLKFFDAIKVRPVDIENGITYRAQTKEMTKFFRTEMHKLKQEDNPTKFYAKQLIGKYTYKGPILEWYLRIKLRMEGYYKFFNDVVPLKATIVDIGCGYGFLPYMLRQVSEDRNIIGIDYDKNKISVANNIARDDDKLNFEVKDVANGEIPAADVYILNDILHYMPESMQLELITKCMNNMSVNGKIILRDANADMVERTKGTKLTELFSTKIFKFNKTNFDLAFISGKKITDLVNANNMEVEVVDNSKFTSNLIYIIKNKI